MRSLGWALTQSSSVLMNRGNWDRWARKGDTGRRQPRREAAEETHSVDMWSVDFGPPGLGEHRFLLFKSPWSVVLCYGSLSKATRPESGDWVRQSWVSVPIGTLPLHVFSGSLQPLPHSPALPCTDPLTAQAMWTVQTRLSHFTTRSRQAEGLTHPQRHQLLHQCNRII